MCLLTLVNVKRKRETQIETEFLYEVSENNSVILYFPPGPVGAVSNRTASAQLETAPTQYGGRKCLFIFRIHYNNLWRELMRILSSLAHWFISRFTHHVSHPVFDRRAYQQLRTSTTG